MNAASDIPKNNREIIRIERQEYRGHDLINLRVWYDDGEGNYKPGKQGVAFQAALIPQVLDAFSALVSAGDKGAD